MSNDDIVSRILDEEGAAAEDAEVDQTARPLPDGVKVTQPGRARSKVLQVRLNPEEYQALEQIAARRDIPVSTLARAELLKAVDAERRNSVVVAGGSMKFSTSVMQLRHAVEEITILAKDLRESVLGSDILFDAAEDFSVADGTVFRRKAHFDLAPGVRFYPDGTARQSLAKEENDD